MFCVIFQVRLSCVLSLYLKLKITDALANVFFLINCNKAFQRVYR